MTTTCTWLVDVPSGHPEPDSYADTRMIVECGTPTEDPRGVCTGHAQLLDMDGREFEAMIEARNG